MNGAKPPKREELPKLRDRISFLYVDQCRIEKKDSAIRFITEDGTVDIPAGMLVVLMLGPGTTVTHRMIQTAAEAGMQIVWVGENSVRFYAGGSPLAGRTDLLTAQAKIVSNQKLRLAAAKRMYKIRYPEDDFTELSMRQLLGREGRHVAERYRELAQKYDIEWKGRKYDPKNFELNDVLQNALSCANACLYGICYSVIFALGLSPGLGIVHTGMAKSFVLDIADIYKESISFPVAFSIISKLNKKELYGPIDQLVRAAMRNAFSDNRFCKTIVSDIVNILGKENIKSDDGRNYIWAGFLENIEGGINHGK